jgi:hypothetical protein
MIGLVVRQSTNPPHGSQRIDALGWGLHSSQPIPHNDREAASDLILRSRARQVRRPGQQDRRAAELERATAE